MQKYYFKNIKALGSRLERAVSESEFINHYLFLEVGTANTRLGLINTKNPCARIFINNEEAFCGPVDHLLITPKKPIKSETNGNPFLNNTLYFKSWSDLRDNVPFLKSESSYYNHHCTWKGLAVSKDYCVVNIWLEDLEKTKGFLCTCRIDCLTPDRPTKKSTTKEPITNTADSLLAYANSPNGSGAKTATATWSKESTKESIRKKCLDDAVKCICSDRNNQYGEPEDNFRIIADYWTTYLKDKKEITAQDVANMMILFKIGRLTVTDGTYDTYVDIAGYAGCGAEILSKKG